MFILSLLSLFLYSLQFLYVEGCDRNIFSIKLSDCRFVGTRIMSEGHNEEDDDVGSSNEVFLFGQYVYMTNGQICH